MFLQTQRTLPNSRKHEVRGVLVRMSVATPFGEV